MQDGQTAICACGTLLWQYAEEGATCLECAGALGELFAVEEGLDDDGVALEVLCVLNSKSEADTSETVLSESVNAQFASYHRTENRDNDDTIAENGAVTGCRCPECRCWLNNVRYCTGANSSIHKKRETQRVCDLCGSYITFRLFGKHRECCGQIEQEEEEEEREEPKGNKRKPRQRKSTDNLISKKQRVRRNKETEQALGDIHGGDTFGGLVLFLGTHIKEAIGAIETAAQ